MEKRIKNIDLGDNLETQDEIKLFPGHMEEQKFKKRISKSMARKLDGKLREEKIDFKIYKENQQLYIQTNKTYTERLNKLINKLKNREIEM